MKIDIREILQNICMVLFLFSFLLIDWNIAVATVCIIVFGGLSFAFEKGIL